MGIERRDTPRIQISLEAILNYSNRDYCHLKTRDISLDGVSVRTPPDLRLRNEPIDIAIGMPGNPDRHFHRFRARLVHATRHGAGFSFEAVEAEAYEALLGVVFSEHPAGAK